MPTIDTAPEVQGEASRFALRPADPADVPALALLGRESFRAAFGHLYRAEDLAVFLDDAYAEEKVANEIADLGTLLHLACDATGLLAYCKLRLASAWTEHSDAENPLTLSQIYTRPELTGQGVGTALMDWALDEARGRGFDAVQLSVWSGNTAAQRFYDRYGFEKIADIDFWVGSQRDDEFLYELRLGAR